MAIPFPPGGPQVQAALQNPARFPDQRLQQYAQGQQPTGQVPPPMAANELTIRNAQRQAASRQSAMQNNPQNSPTVFQQKDMELQQKAQQLAAMQQQMQQKEQQLGVVGALMAKKAQDLQAREQGIAALSLPQNIFTAMNGGVVFNRGGGVQGYASRGLVTPDLGVFNEDRPSFSVPASAPKKSKDDLEEEDMLARLLSPAEQLADFSKISTLTKEERDRKKEERIKELEEQYKRYKEGIGGLDEETAAAIRGKPTSMLQKLAAGLPTDTRGMRLGTGIASIAKGYMGEVAKEESREQEAAKYLAAAKRKQAEADFAEMRGRDDLAKKAVDEAQALLDKAYSREKDVAALSTEAAKAGATYLSGRDKAASQAALRERALELKQQQLSINEALAQGRINQMQAQAQMAGVTAELRALSAQNAALAAQSSALQAQSSARGRMREDLQNDPTFQNNAFRISQLMKKPSLTPKENEELTKLQTQQETIKKDLMVEYGLSPRSGAAPGAATPSVKPPPAVGTVIDGYKFKGGDPSNKNSWEKV